MDNLVKRFLRYVSIETTSNESEERSPSSLGQITLGGILVQELLEMGIQDAVVDKNGFVMATIPSTISKEVPTIGFIAHLDTSPDAVGKGIHTRIVRYDGSDIVLNKEKNVVLSPSDFPEMTNYLGHDFIVTDGNTLLGADDKAGIAEIMTMVEYFISHPEIEHGKIRIAFTPDEEIGRGANLFDVERFGADWAYTVDGGEVGELEYENFNAAMATITIEGRSVHPGSAKNKMINAALLAVELASKLPKDEVPEKTENYEGFFHLIEISGSVEKSTMRYLIRDHDKELFEKRKIQLRDFCDQLKMQHTACRIHLDIVDQYYNMKEKIEPVIKIVNLAEKAMFSCGVVPKIQPVRGGTDGAQLSFKGLPCPNIFSGGLNFHGRYECVPISSMEAAVKVLIGISKLAAK